MRHEDDMKEDASGAISGDEDVMNATMTGTSREMGTRKRCRPSIGFVIFVVVANVVFIAMIAALTDTPSSEAKKTNETNTTRNLASEIDISACRSAEDQSLWLWTAPTLPDGHPSCHSASGGVNDMGNRPTMCAGDPTSVRLEMRPNLAECLFATTTNCEILMRNFRSLDYDFFAESDCRGLWTAPLWISPNLWQFPAESSGEIDSSESCQRTLLRIPSFFLFRVATSHMCRFVRSGMADELCGRLSSGRVRRFGRHGPILESYNDS